MAACLVLQPQAPRPQTPPSTRALSSPSSLVSHTGEIATTTGVSLLFTNAPTSQLPTSGSSLTGTLSASLSQTHTTTDVASRLGSSSPSRSAFIGASAGLSAAAFITTIAAILLFRRDRRITKAAEKARLERHPRSFAPSGLHGTNLSGVQVPEGRGARVHKATLDRPTPGTFEGRVWRA
ncbi:hypothetical protein TRAPUB_10271 [Trametes pubescens]|uniref:Uncharacterized protein n=1 Tax=Trametes pubescens TaxID=154538 RepID=A0A1M2W078_TRAPU|nr:hypothetical protein TRAPUB_10271 [Trametes pubescens]